MNSINDNQNIKEQTRHAVQSGTDVHEKIKNITLNALSKRQLDTENIEHVIKTVSLGINEALSTQAIHAKSLFSEAITALDDSLAVATEASKLAIEEAFSRVGEYSQHDLIDAINNVQNMEGLFLDTLESVAKDGNQVFIDIVGDFINHARNSGTVVGRQALAALEPLTKLRNLSKETIISNSIATTVTLAQVASGILLGIAESLQSSYPNKRSNE